VQPDSAAAVERDTSRTALARAMALIDADLHAPYLGALQYLLQPDRHSVRDLLREFARLSVR
jgi:hypothetical protein